TLSIDDSRRVILVTGPNTGGKTIALKTIGLMVLMAQSGLPLPASDKTEMGIFQQVFADIGDEQSIELSLSTFSSHIKNIISAISKVSSDSLVLFDEIGAGTDPKEGAALAEAIILFLIGQGARLVATTHFSHLKTLALDNPEIENASLEFDRKSLAPTYRMQLGIPGSSYAVEIASRLGMDPQICGHASTLLGSGERTLTDLIASLESELATLRTDKAKLSERLATAKELEEFYRTQTDKLKSEVNDRKKEALAETEQLLEKTRKETERIVAEIRKTQADDVSVKQAHQFLKATEDDLTSQQRELARESSRLLDQSSFAKGDHVRILSLGQEGQIDELVSGKKARVQVGNVTTVVPLRDLEKLAGDVTLKAGLTTARYDTQTPASPEIHLRGMTVDEATDALDKFLDNAVVSGLTQVYVIHGKGTGTLRRTLTEWLKSHSEVVGLRLGNWNEGGAGVTVVKLKE
ncbi:MAG: Smr/MutS family protein, partial [Candidatus Zixiibacteriota bacterium]